MSAHDRVIKRVRSGTGEAAALARVVDQIKADAESPEFQALLKRIRELGFRKAPFEKTFGHVRCRRILSGVFVPGEPDRGRGPINAQP